MATGMVVGYPPCPLAGCYKACWRLSGGMGSLVTGLKAYLPEKALRLHHQYETGPFILPDRKPLISMADILKVLCQAPREL